jgi:hypothetical protein
MAPVDAKNGTTDLDATLRLLKHPIPDMGVCRFRENVVNNRVRTNAIPRQCARFVPCES